MTIHPLRNVIISGILTIGFIIGFRISPRPTSLLPLPVPTITKELSYSGPLALTNISQSVLGAQAIDPIDFVNEINSVREKAGAPFLRLSTTLMKAAAMRAEVIRKHQNFSHQDPFEGIELGTVLPKLEYAFVYASENIGMGGSSAQNFVAGFMNSTTHRNNLLDPTLTETGAAIVDGPYKQYYVNYAVQLFAIPGGRDEYLGYKDKDRLLYEKELLAVKKNLHPFVWLVARIKRNPLYTDAYHNKLIRQKMILETVLSLMRETKPLENKDVALILEYNALL